MKLRKELTTAFITVLVFTVLLGVAYPLAMTGIAQVAFPGRANGSEIKVGGRVVGSKLLARPLAGARYRPTTARARQRSPTAGPTRPPRAPSTPSSSRPTSGARPATRRA